MATYQEQRYSTRYRDAINKLLEQRSAKELLDKKFEGRAVLASTSDDYVPACSLSCCRYVLSLTYLLRREVQYVERVVV